MATTLTTRRASRLPSLWRRDPFTALLDEMSDLRARLFGDEESLFSDMIAPSLDVVETEAAVEVRMDLPGVPAKDIDIQVSGNLLTISGQRKEEKEEKGRTFHRVERRSGNYSRSISLPCPVVEDEVAAEYHDGVVTVKLPKTKDSKAHKIKVNS